MKNLTLYFLDFEEGERLLFSTLKKPNSIGNPIELGNSMIILLHYPLCE